MGTFDIAVDFVLKAEGGYSSDPNDPGGETNFGISKRFHPDLNVRELTREGAIDIYRRNYWDANKLNELAPGLAIAAFDCAVNQGPARMRRILAECKGDIVEFFAQRAFQYAILQSRFPQFELGWMRRLFRCFKLSLTADPTFGKLAGGGVTGTNT